MSVFSQIKKYQQKTTTTTTTKCGAPLLGLAKSIYSKHPHKRTSGIRTSRLKFVILDTCFIRTLQLIYDDLFRLTLKKVGS